ncbi:MULTISPECIES: signal peptidase I [unclassified Streptomyces]|uniref:signal peptidase I n=1 Tax=unclassified Streptomyces TaxID=2593676 RepID=UPI0022540FEB|nr:MULTISPECIES: signal peptidase I [unclassified Streptomyces]MCX5143226.1 signal peptidase I [Streptomyces sp. NBC_00338]WRZ67656.1 signal peptidase I [Streptomyces sp. NBC_01257]WSU61640.1 signal peptidase I [Streptomyces sp. NBC_01104]
MGNRGRGHGAADPAIPLPTGTRPTAARSLPTRAERRKLARKVKRRRRRSAVKEIPVLITVALLIALVLKTFLVQAFVIPSGSMEQTIRIGDRVLVDKLTPWFGSRPQRGDVVVFKNPSDWPPPNPVDAGGSDSPVVIKQVKEALTFIGLLPSDDEQDLIKRVVAVGGDTVKCCEKDGRLIVNGVAVDEPYIYPGDSPSTIKFEVKVPAGRIFVMGDHRSNSADSRFHLDKTADGTVSEDAVVGRAVVIAWPFGHWSRLEERSAFSSVPDARAGTAAAPGPSNSVSQDPNGMIRLPTPAELPLVMGVVGLHRLGRRRWHGIRSGCGGFGGRRTIRTRRTRGPAGHCGECRARRDDGGLDGE